MQDNPGYFKETIIDNVALIADTTQRHTFALKVFEILGEKGVYYISNMENISDGLFANPRYDSMLRILIEQTSHMTEETPTEGYQKLISNFRKSSKYKKFSGLDSTNFEKFARRSSGQK